MRYPFLIIIFSVQQQQNIYICETNIGQLLSDTQVSLLSRWQEYLFERKPSEYSRENPEKTQEEHRESLGRTKR